MIADPITDVALDLPALLGGVEDVDQPADRPVEHRIHRADEAAADEKKHERPFCLPREIEDEAPGRLGQHLALRILERVDDALESRPQAREHRVYAV